MSKGMAIGGPFDGLEIEQPAALGMTMVYQRVNAMPVVYMRTRKGMEFVCIQKRMTKRERDEMQRLIERLQESC